MQIAFQAAYYASLTDLPHLEPSRMGRKREREESPVQQSSKTKD